MTQARKDLHDAVASMRRYLETHELSVRKFVRLRRGNERSILIKCPGGHMAHVGYVVE